MSAPAQPLAPDLVAGLKRLKLAKVRAMAPEFLQAAKVQRWSPEELLRTLVEDEIAARDESNARARLRSAGFPVTKTLAEFNVGLSSVPQARWDYLASLEWIRATENLCLVGPAGTGKSHALIALGHAAVSAGMRVRYFAAADLVETLDSATCTRTCFVLRSPCAPLEAGVPLREVQIAARHADPRTTTVYDHRRQSVDRHAAYVVVAFVAGDDLPAC